MEASITLARLNRSGSAAVRMARRSGQLAITERGRTVAFLLSKDKVESLLDTLEVLADAEAMSAMKAYSDGKLAMKPVESLDD